jgi:hypothetical protein
MSLLPTLTGKCKATTHLAPFAPVASQRHRVSDPFPRSSRHKHSPRKSLPTKLLAENKNKSKRKVPNYSKSRADDRSTEEDSSSASDAGSNSESESGSGSESEESTEDDSELVTDEEDGPAYYECVLISLRLVLAPTRDLISLSQQLRDPRSDLCKCEDSRAQARFAFLTLTLTSQPDQLLRRSSLHQASRRARGNSTGIPKLH